MEKFKIELEKWLDENDIIDVYKHLVLERKKIEACIKEIEYNTLSFAQGLSKEEQRGLNIEVRNGYAQYKFNHISEWQNIANQINQLKEKQKAIEETAKLALKKGTSIVLEDTGEYVEMAQVDGYTKTAIVVKG